MDELLERILKITCHIRKDDLHAAEIAFLMDTGIPAQQDGYEHLVHAIMLFHGDPELSFTKEIYPEVARMSKKNPSWMHVEKTIRYSIKAAWQARDKRILEIYFPPDEGGRLRRPTNAEYISRMAQILELWQGCCWEENQNAECAGAQVNGGVGKSSSE